MLTIRTHLFLSLRSGLFFQKEDVKSKYFHATMRCCKVSLWRHAFQSPILRSGLANMRYLRPWVATIVSVIRFNRTIISPITGPRCPESSRKLRFPHYVTMAQDGDKVVSLTHRPPLPPRNAPGTHSC